MATIYTIVDKRDIVVGYKPSAELHPGDIYRIASLWIINDEDQTLLAQRDLTKASDPGKWGPAAAGRVEKGETYESNIHKEAREEINFDAGTFISAPKVFIPDNGYGHGLYLQMYVVKANLPLSAFRMQTSEVMGLQWWENQTIDDTLRAHPELFTVNFGECHEAMKKFLKHYDD